MPCEMKVGRGEVFRSGRERQFNTTSFHTPKLLIPATSARS